MKRNYRNCLVAAIVLVLAGGGMLAACGEEEDPPADNRPPTEISGTEETPEVLAAPTECEPNTSWYRCCGCGTVGGTSYQKVRSCWCTSSGRVACSQTCRYLGPRCGWNGCS